MSSCLQWVEGGTEAQEGAITKGHVETFKGDGYVHYLDCGIS